MRPCSSRRKRSRSRWHQVDRGQGAARPSKCPITDADIGDTWVNIAFLKDDRLYRAENGSCACRQRSRGAAGVDRRGAGGGEAARPGRLHDQDDGCVGRAGAGAGQPGGRRRSGVRGEAGRNARPAALLLSPRIQPRLDAVLPRLLVHRLLGHAAARSSRGAAASARARRLQGRPAKRARTCGRSSPTRSTGSPIW